MACILPMVMTVVAAATAIVLIVFSFLDMNMLMRRVFATVGLLVGAFAVLVSIPFGYVGLFFAPCAYVSVFYWEVDLVRFEEGVRDWGLFSLCALLGNVVLGWCFGVVLDQFRRLFKS